MGRESRQTNEVVMNDDRDDFNKMTDEELIASYFKAVTLGTFNMYQAGRSAGILLDRGYELIETDEKTEFVKPAEEKPASSRKKVA
jgi:hypothetical protein